VGSESVDARVDFAVLTLQSGGERTAVASIPDVDSATIKTIHL
jgi:hypothetical protein